MGYGSGIKMLPDMLRRDSHGKMVRDEQMEETFAAFSCLASKRKLAVPRTKQFSRQDVIEAFQDAFELIGGESRLATWAHANPGEFYKLFARLLPAQTVELLGGQNTQTKIVCEIQPGELDKPNQDFVDKNSTLEVVDNQSSADI